LTIIIWTGALAREAGWVWLGALVNRLVTIVIKQLECLVSFGLYLVQLYKNTMIRSDLPIFDRQVNLLVAIIISIRKEVKLDNMIGLMGMSVITSFVMHCSNGYCP
jgi:hypothetical protein